MLGCLLGFLNAGLSPPSSDGGWRLRSKGKHALLDNWEHSGGEGGGIVRVMSDVERVRAMSDVACRDRRHRDDAGQWRDRKITRHK
ncbi:hypothetical protein U1Q18_011444 [Sarracenia purpurea var. burkii]